MNPHEQAARTVKAYRIADFVTVPVEIAEQASLDWWIQVARAIGVNPPSQTTVDLVLSILRSRSEAARNLLSETSPALSPGVNGSGTQPEGEPAASSLVSA